MFWLIIGLGVFFALHYYSAFRRRDPAHDIKAKIGEGRYMGLYSLGSLVGFALIIFGYRQAPPGALLYAPPGWTHAVSLLAMAAAFVLMVAAYAPLSRIKIAVRHPMVISVVLWAGAHLLAPTTTKELLLFGAFFVYGLVDFAAAYHRPGFAAPPTPPPWRNDLIVIAAGAGAYLVMLFWAHRLFFGVAPLMAR